MVLSDKASCDLKGHSNFDYSDILLLQSFSLTNSLVCLRQQNISKTRQDSLSGKNICLLVITYNTHDCLTIEWNNWLSGFSRHKITKQNIFLWNLAFWTINICVKNATWPTCTHWILVIWNTQACTSRSVLYHLLPCFIPLQ